MVVSVCVCSVNIEPRTKSSSTSSSTNTRRVNALCLLNLVCLCVASLLWWKERYRMQGIIIVVVAVVVKAWCRVNSCSVPFRPSNVLDWKGRLGGANGGHPPTTDPPTEGAQSSLANRTGNVAEYDSATVSAQTHGELIRVCASEHQARQECSTHPKARIGFSFGHLGQSVHTHTHSFIHSIQSM